jgi:hypothetical protein
MLTEIESTKPRQKWAIIDLAFGRSDEHRPAGVLKLDMRMGRVPEHQEVAHFSKFSGDPETFHGELSRAHPEKLIGSRQNRIQGEDVRIDP